MMMRGWMPMLSRHEAISSVVSMQVPIFSLSTWSASRMRCPVFTKLAGASL